MKITDLNGYEIEVTDLKEAICIAKRNTGYSQAMILRSTSITRKNRKFCA